MRVDFYGTYRLLVGEKTIEVDLPPGGTVLDLLCAVTRAVPALRHELFDAQDCLFAYIPLFVNGRNPRLWENGIHAVVDPGAVVSIFSPVASGRLNVEDINQAISEENQ